MILINPSCMRFCFPWILWKGPSDRREIVLTFDDGPHPVYTPETIDILNLYRAKAVFFLNGQDVLLHPGIVEKLKNAGHILATHGFTHRKLDFQRRSRIVEEMESGMCAVGKIAGKRPGFFRPPYGRFDLRFRRILRHANLKMVLWSLLTCDFRETEPETLVRTVRDRIHNGAILVFHDGHPNAPVMLKALPDILRTVHRLDFRIASLDDWAGGMP